MYCQSITKASFIVQDSQSSTKCNQKSILDNKLTKYQSSGLKQLVYFQKQLISYVFYQGDSAAMHVQKTKFLVGNKRFRFQFNQDLDEWSVQFDRMAMPYLNVQKKLAKQNITESFKGKNMYVFLRLINPGDTAEVISS